MKKKKNQLENILWGSGKTILITLCTFKHIPDWGKKIVILERIQLNKNKAGRLNYKKRLREYKALLY